MRSTLRALWATLLLMAMAAHAAPITQNWKNPNPDAQYGLFDSMAFRFVSQSGGQTGFHDVLISPVNGWTSLGFDPQLTYAVGAPGRTIFFDLVFDGLATDQVQWEVFYFLDKQALGGARYVGDVGHKSFAFVLEPAASGPAAVPEPATLMLSGLGLLACSLLTRRRPAQQPT